MIAGIRYWSGGRVAAVFTLLLAGFFTLSIALGASSFIAGVVGVLFIIGSIALATHARARAHFALFPTRSAAPLAPVRDFPTDDFPEHDLEDELGSLDDLARTFGDPPSTARRAPATPPMPPTQALPPPSPPATIETATTPATTHDDPAHLTEEPAVDPMNDEPSNESDTAVAVLPHKNKEIAPSPPVPIPKQQTVKDIDKRDTPTLESDTAEGIDDQAAIDAAEALAVLDVLDLDVFDRGDDESSEEQIDHAFEVPGPSAVDVLSAYVGMDEGLPEEAVRDVAATIVVSDLDRSLTFYTELLGLVEIDRAVDAVLLEAGFGRVLLWQRDDAPVGGNTMMHLTFEVGDIDVAYRTLSARGITFTHPPRSALAGAIHEVKAASFLDPDGHGLAITELKRHN